MVKGKFTKMWVIQKTARKRTVPWASDCGLTSWSLRWEVGNAYREQDPEDEAPDRKL